MTASEPPTIPPEQSRTPAWIAILTCIALTLATLAVYWQTFDFDLVDLDDHGYVGDFSGPVSGGLTPSSIVWAFKDTHMANWHPVTWLSYLLDRTIQEDGWGVFHITSVVLHILNTLVLYGVLRMLTGAQWPSALVAALHALHPAHVESVAWISERKDVLSGLFWMLTIWAYARYVRGSRGTGRWSWYGLTAVFLVLGLMAKSMLVTLPLVLLLLDLWPLRRMEQALGGGRPPAGVADVARAFVRLLRDKIPLLAIVAVVCVVTYLAQQSMGAMRPMSMRSRAINAVVAYVRYLWMLIWPDDLVVFYPQPNLYNMPMWPLWLGVLCAAIVAASTIGAVLLWRRAPWVTVGWLWFVGTLTPVIGFPVQVGNQAMADRYTYIPFIGLYIALAWTLAAALARGRASAILRTSIAALAITALAGLGWRAWDQARVWRNSETLFEHGLNVDPDNFRMHEVYATALQAQNRYPEAEVHLRRCVELVPTYTKTMLELGMVQAAQRKGTSATETLQRVIELDPGNAPAHFNLGQIYLATGDPARGLIHMERAVQLDPDNALYRERLARARRPD